jgi:hypothetical protein
MLSLFVTSRSVMLTRPGHCAESAVSSVLGLLQAAMTLWIDQR